MSNSSFTAVINGIEMQIPRPGEYWEGQGGVLINFQPAEGDLADRFLIAAADSFGDIKFGGYGKDVPGASSFIDGAANTRALLESPHDHPAAQKAAAYTKDGHSDFVLPAQRQLNLVYATVPHLFPRDWIWSSTQYSANLAWVQIFDDGYQTAYNKNLTGFVLPVRSLLIQ